MAVGDRVPIVFVLEVENLFSAAVDELNPLAAIIETADILARNGTARPVKGVKGIHVAHHQYCLTRSETGDGAAGKVEGNAIDETDAAQIQRGRADVLQFNVFVVRGRIDASRGQGGGV